MWLIVVKDNLKACIPFKGVLRQILRRLSPYRSTQANDELAFQEGLQLIRIAEGHRLSLDTVLEVGTGWIPTIPHMLKARGAEQIILTDIEPLSDPNTFRYARDLVERSLDQVAEVCAVEPQSLMANLGRDGVEEYRCPPRTDELPSGSVDLVYSRTVLEHIRSSKLSELLVEWQRLLRPGGFCVHFIDNSDHFEHRDKRLSRVNFLTVSDWAWEIACFNQQNYQNRLRHSDYVRLFSDAGFELLQSEGEPDARALTDLERLAIKKRFSRYENEDLAILKSIIVARKHRA